MTGTAKLKPLVIGKSRNPRAFKNVRSLLVDYRWNQKAWMTSAIFTEWLLQLEKKMKEQKRHIAVILDNCSAHSKVPKMTYVKVLLLPPNCTSVLQPLDQGIIRSLKSHYRRRMLEEILINIEAKVPKPTNIDIRQAIEMLTGAWRSVMQEVVETCWRKAWFIESRDDGTIFTAANCCDEPESLQRA
ncbi:tigger transposable element-derived protein 6-like [Ornithodoros turicata]|uniref:tigger transposable element-derived protein 6-like n=1 Tax=Ornithodoros turicata TaxID=34597 RepID=UPI00313918C7